MYRERVHPVMRLIAVNVLLTKQKILTCSLLSLVKNEFLVIDIRLHKQNKQTHRQIYIRFSTENFILNKILAPIRREILFITKGGEKKNIPSSSFFRFLHVVTHLVTIIVEGNNDTGVC